MNLLSPAEVSACFGRAGIPSRFSANEAARLEATEPVGGPGYFVFPTPEENQHLSVLGLRRLLGLSPEGGPCFFFDHPWYLEEPFGEIPLRPGWHAVAMTPLERSLGQPVYYAEELRSERLFLPHACEVVLMVFLAMMAGGDRLLARKHTWTRDRTTGRRFVSVGAFGGKGLFLSSHEVGYASRGLGICPARDV